MIECRKWKKGKLIAVSVVLPDRSSVEKVLAHGIAHTHTHENAIASDGVRRAQSHGFILANGIRVILGDIIVHVRAQSVDHDFRCIFPIFFFSTNLN